MCSCWILGFLFGCPLYGSSKPHAWSDALWLQWASCGTRWSGEETLTILGSIDLEASSWLHSLPHSLASHKFLCELLPCLVSQGCSFCSQLTGTDFLAVSCFVVFLLYTLYSCRRWKKSHVMAIVGRRVFIHVSDSHNIIRICVTAYTGI